MPFKRPPRSNRSSSESSHSATSNNISDEDRPRKRLKSTNEEEPSTNGHLVKIHIVQAKLDSDAISKLYSLIEDRRQNGVQWRLCHDVREADVVVTAVHMRKRLERHIDWNIAKDKAIVSPRWLIDSAEHNKPMPCGNYAALSDLQEETEKNCPDSDDGECDSTMTPKSESASPRQATRDGTPELTASRTLSYTSAYACARESPLVCPNQELIEQIDIVRQSRELDGENRSALSYERGIAALKAYPRPITKQDLTRAISKIPYVGSKILSMVEEYVKTGQISEAQSIADSSRFQSLFAFAKIYGIGPTTARRLYALGLRTIEHLERYYDIENGTEDESLRVDMIEVMNKDAKDESEDLLTEKSIKLALSLREDLEQKIPRDEVDEMYRVVMHELHFLQKGCTGTIVGGYRRGKSESNDVDIVITHSSLQGGDKVKGLCKRLVNRLYEQGLITHVMHLSSFHAHNALRTTHWDSLEKALTIFVLPPRKGSPRPIHRRLDLIFAAPEVYWTAVVGWTGSKMFQRDLRRWAKDQKGLKFDSSGITRRRDSKLLFPQSEQEVFDVLGLEWVHPTMRNADA